MAGIASPLTNGPRLLFVLKGANMNSTADQAFTPQGAIASYMPTQIISTNASVSLTLAAGGVYDTAAKGGTAIVAAAQVYSSQTTALKNNALTLANTDTRTAAPILSLTTAQGSAALSDLFFFGITF